MKNYEKVLLAIVTLVAVIVMVFYMSFLSKRDRGLIQTFEGNTSVVWSDWEE